MSSLYRLLAEGHATEAALEGVAHERTHTIPRTVQAHASGRVARRVDDAEPAEHRQDVAILDRQRVCGGSGVMAAKNFPRDGRRIILAPRGRQPVTVGRVDEHRDAGQRQLAGAAGMVGMDRACRPPEASSPRGWPCSLTAFSIRPRIVRSRSRSATARRSRTRCAKTRPSGIATTSRVGRVGCAAFAVSPESRRTHRWSSRRTA